MSSSIASRHGVDLPASATRARSDGSVATRATLWRVGLFLACAVLVLAAYAAGRPEHFLADDADLGRLLRGMALIKGGLALAAFALVSWRFAHPLSMPMAIGYVAGVSLAAAAAMLVWQLTFIVGAAVAFHVGELTLLALAWCDRDGIAGLRTAR